MQFSDGTEYTKDCRDFSYTGVECCETCHEYGDEFDVVLIDGGPALLCCTLRRFFYPDGDDVSMIQDSRLSPEEKLLRAIFRGSHGPPNREED